MAPSIFVKNLQRSPEHRTARKLRPTNRLGFLLDDGTRLRRKGRSRLTELGMDKFAANIEKIVEGVEQGYLEVFEDGDGLRSVSLGMLKAFRLDHMPPVEVPDVPEDMVDLDAATVSKYLELVMDGMSDEEARAVVFPKTPSSDEGSDDEEDEEQEGSGGGEEGSEQSPSEEGGDHGEQESSAGDGEGVDPGPSEEGAGEEEPVTLELSPEEFVNKLVAEHNRKHLNEMALEKGVADPESFSNKRELATAIVTHSLPEQD